MDLFQEIESFKGKELSGKALMELADLALYSFTEAEDRFSILGICFDKEQMQVRVKGEQKIDDIISFSLSFKPDEQKAIYSSMKSLLTHRYSGNSLSETQGQQLTKSLFIILALVQHRSSVDDKNADRILDWLLQAFKDLEESRNCQPCVRNSLENLTILKNTFLGHLNRNRTRIPYRYPNKEKFYIYLALELINNPDAKPKTAK